MTDVKPSLKTVLKRLKLSGLVPVLPDRASYAQKTSLAPLDFLELALQDEIDRREQKNLTNRVTRAGFTDPQTFEDFDWNVPVTFDRDRLRDLFNLQFLEQQPVVSLLFRDHGHPVLRLFPDVLELFRQLRQRFCSMCIDFISHRLVEARRRG